MLPSVPWEGCAGCVGFDEGNLPVNVGDGNGRDYSPGSQRPIPQSLGLVITFDDRYPALVPRGTIWDVCFVRPRPPSHKIPLCSGSSRSNCVKHILPDFSLSTK